MANGKRKNADSKLLFDRKQKRKGIFHILSMYVLTIGLQGFKALSTKYRTEINLSDEFKVHEVKVNNVDNFISCEITCEFEIWFMICFFSTKIR